MTYIFRTKKINWIQYLIYCFVFMLIVIVCIPNSLPINFANVMCIIFFLSLSILCFVLFLHYYQVIIFDRTGITFKSLLKKYVFIKWQDVKKIEVINKKTYSSSNGYNVYYNWIKITLNLVYSKNKSSIEILYTKRNLRVLLNYVSKYNDNILFDKDLQENSEIPIGKWFK